MSKKRVYELAKELNVSSKELMNMLEKRNIKVKSHMAMLTSSEVEQIQKVIKEHGSIDNVPKAPVQKAAEPKPQNNKAKPAQKNPAPQKKPAGQNHPQDADKKENRGSRKETPKKNPAQKDRSQQKSRRGQQAQQGKNKRGRQKQAPQKKEMPPIDLDKEVEIESNIVVKDLSQKLGIGVSQLMGKLMMLGVMANQNQEIGFEYAELVASEFGRKVVLKESRHTLDTESETGDIFGLDFEDKEEELVPRSPVITVMGHVDHGKTSLLDAIRDTNVTRGEAGGITQHIGAYTITIQGEKIVFLDTPGHEAFTTMRARGAMVTDLAILVVAADDGVMPQTIEAINHAKAAEVPIIVAINKMDKPDANPDRVKQELAEHGIVPEEWGGDAIMVEVSALKHEGIDDLLEMILMVAEMQELKANPKRAGIGTVIEAQLDKGRGPVATIIVEKGSFHASDMVVTGSSSGRIRAMYDDKWKQIKKAGPSMPIQIQGLSDVPNAGDKIFVVEDERTARGYADLVKAQQREDMIQTGQKVSLDDLFERIQEGELQDLNIIVKTDVRGTIDAVRQSFEKLSNDEVRVNIIHGAVGGITQSDVQLATASNAIIIGFNVRPTQVALDMAKDEDVDIRTYRVIYEAIDDIEAAIKGMLAPTLEEEVIGRAEVRQTFRVPNAGTVAGIYVRSGKVTRNASIRLLRQDIVIFEGSISSLKRFKDDAREINTGYEGGLSIENYNDVKEGDIIEAYIIKEIAQ
ncbi:MAG: translation initiation factor IF-2 [Tissierellia bacterium]|jgi:translation initiation factor IF-2|nr:translation initiation factor IF-2 [Bacillota bacterium]NLK59262.1 translation initiation factor IF-2 [Tissierellia bacterium]